VSWARFFVASSEPGASRPPAWIRGFNFILALLCISLVLFFCIQSLPYKLQWSAVYSYRALLLDGWLTTLQISLVALCLSTLIGLAFALAQRASFLPLRYFSKIYIEVVRGTPLLVQILFFFYVVAFAFKLSDRYVAGMLILSIFSGAYIAEIIRAGIESVGKSQLESARAIGLTPAQTYRYVIFPQVLRQTLPPLAGQFVSLVKDSSLLYVIGLGEFTAAAQEINARTYNSLESYIPLALGYLILTLPISLWTRHLERRHKYET
jgi:polar amino acid transport system permease protein